MKTLLKKQMIRNLNTYTFLIFTTILSFFVMASFKTETGTSVRESGWFGFIDDTVFVFIAMAVPFFIILLIYSIAGNAFKKTTSNNALNNLSSSQKALLYLTHPLFILIAIHTKFKSLIHNISKSRFIKYGLLMALTILAIYFFSHTAFVSWQPFSAKANTLRNSFVLIPMVFGYSYLKDAGIFNRFEFWKSEFFKIAFIFFGTILMLVIADAIAFSIDAKTFININKSPFYDSPELIAIGFTLAIGIANLFNNMTLTYLSTRYKT